LASALALAVALFASIGHAAEPSNCETPPAMADSWKVSSPEQQNVTPTLI
jgi:hypothetical protein